MFLSHPICTCWSLLSSTLLYVCFFTEINNNTMMYIMDPFIHSNESIGRVAGPSKGTHVDLILKNLISRGAWRRLKLVPHSKCIGLPSFIVCLCSRRPTVANFLFASIWRIFKTAPMVLVVHKGSREATRFFISTVSDQHILRFDCNMIVAAGATIFELELPELPELPTLVKLKTCACTFTKSLLNCFFNGRWHRV